MFVLGNSMVFPANALVLLKKHSWHQKNTPGNKRKAFHKHIVDTHKISFPGGNRRFQSVKLICSEKNPFGFIILGQGNTI